MKLMNAQNHSNPQNQMIQQNPVQSQFVPQPNFQQNPSFVQHNPNLMQTLNSSQTLIPNQSLIMNSIQPQPRYQVDVKRISHISSTFEKRKIFFSGKPGSDPERFITYLEECGRFMGLSERELFCSLPIVLTNEALEWFRLEEKNIQNFTAFKAAFLEHYRIQYYQDRLLEQARQRTQALSESITSFLTCIRIIFDKMNPQLSLARQLDMGCQN